MMHSAKLSSLNNIYKLTVFTFDDTGPRVAACLEARANCHHNYYNNNLGERRRAVRLCLATIPLRYDPPLVGDDRMQLLTGLRRLL